MNVLNFDARQCERIRRQLDAYLSNELLVETTSDVLRHLETCEACTLELAARARVREALRRATINRIIPPEELRQSIARQIRKRQSGYFGGFPRLVWATALAAIIVAVVGGIATQRWLGLRHERRIVAGVLAIGVADHVQCAIKGHNYPDVANPPEKLRKKLGPQYAGLVDIVQQKLQGFEILEAHICSIPGSSRKYIHFITRGRGTILSVILTHSDGGQLPGAVAFRSNASGDIDLYAAHLDGMNAVGFASRAYWGFVVSDLPPNTVMETAAALAPPLKAALDSNLRSDAQMDWTADPVGCRAASPQDGPGRKSADQNKSRTQSESTSLVPGSSSKTKEALRNPHSLPPQPVAPSLS